MASGGVASGGVAGGGVAGGGANWRLWRGDQAGAAAGGRPRAMMRSEWRAGRRAASNASQASCGWHDAPQV